MTFDLDAALAERAALRRERDEARAERDAALQQLDALRSELGIQPLIDAHVKLLGDVSAALGEQDVATIDMAPAVRKLRAERDAALARIDKVLDHHERIHNKAEGTTWCAACGPVRFGWPCPTVRALSDPNPED